MSNTRLPKTKIQEQRHPVFRLTSLAYSEFLGDPRQWVLEPFCLGEANLLVGTNSAGKSRVLSVIFGLAHMINGERKKVFESGHYIIKLQSNELVYDYELFVRNSRVVKENLARNGKLLLERGENGVGQIWAERIEQMLDFEAPPDQLAAKARRDSIQHGFFEDLFTWADTARFFPFGSSLGRHEIPTVTQEMVSPSDLSMEISHADRVVQIYVRAFQEFGERFDKAVLKDFALLGYSCSDVGAKAENMTGVDSPVLLLYVKEKGIRAEVNQLNMSQGMYRALSLVIQINYIIFKKRPRMLLIDDIGEGLDFSRSKIFIDMLIERAVRNNIQLIMTTNDRFVMNGVPLHYWGVVDREGARVRVINKDNSPAVFEEYEEVGLNNFDFFAGKYYKNLQAPE